MLEAMNFTFLDLFPKKDGANHLYFFRPTLCNVVYDIITKLIAERIKPFLLILISDEHGDFVARKEILDGVVAAF